MDNINEEQLRQFLKDRLQIKIETKEQHDYYKELCGYEIKVSLELSGEQIDYDSTLIFIK